MKSPAFVLFFALTTSFAQSATDPVPVPKCPAELTRTVSLSPVTRLATAWAAFTAGTSPRDFIARFPKVKYVATNHDLDAFMIPFLEQVFAMDFNAPEARQVTLRYVRHKEYLFGLFPLNSTRLRREPETWTLSSDLERGWRWLGLVGDDGRFRPHVSLREIRERFAAHSGWKVEVIHPAWYTGVRKNFRSDCGSYRRNRILEQTVVVDDLVDYLFTLPLLALPETRSVVSYFSKLELFNHEKFFAEPGGNEGEPEMVSLTPTPETVGTDLAAAEMFSILAQVPESIFDRKDSEMGLFGRLLFQQSDGEILYSGGPLVAQRRSSSKIEAIVGKARSSARQLREKLESELSDAEVRAWLEIYSNVESPMFNLYYNGPAEQLSDFVVRALACHIHDFVVIIHRSGTFPLHVREHLRRVTTILEQRWAPPAPSPQLPGTP